MTEKKKPGPRTTVGSPERARIAQEVFAGMREGLASWKACKAAGVAQSAFMEWVSQDAELAEEYARARSDLIERMANEVLEISDQDVEVSSDGKRDWAAIQKHKLQVDTRKWLLSKMAPKKYGEKLELTGDPDRPVAIQRIERVVVKK